MIFFGDDFLIFDAKCRNCTILEQLELKLKKKFIFFNKTRLSFKILTDFSIDTSVDIFTNPIFEEIIIRVLC